MERSSFNSEIINLIVILAIVVFFYVVLHPLEEIAYNHSFSSAISSAIKNTPPPVILSNACAGNSFGVEKIIVSISLQHLWACEGTSQVYNTPVTTGAYEVNNDGTPIGTWKIYAKQTNRYLSGPGYKYFVYYWMPFYGNYGFHDAVWQNFPFGSPLYPTEGSHGCVHLSLADAKWLFNWASVGTTVTVKN